VVRLLDRFPRPPLPARALLALATLAALGAPGAAPAATVWTTSATEKIRPSAGARSDTAARISAARNEFEAFQVVVTGSATGVQATASALVGPATIPAPRLYRVGIINARYASSLDGGTGWWPDALVPDRDELVGEQRNAFPFSVAAGESRAIWVEAHVPADALPGEYSGTVSLAWQGGSATVPVTLTVWPFTLPSTASLRTAFGFYYGAIPAGHGVNDPAAVATIRARYGQLALDHRISLSHFDDGGSVLSHLGTTYSSLVGGAAATSLPGAALTAVEYIGPGSYSDWASAARAGGWFDRLFQYTCDEPPITCLWPDIPVRAAAAKAADPEFRTLVTTTIQEATDHGVASSIDIIVPVINYLDDRIGNSAFAGNQRDPANDRYAGFLQGHDHEVWSYQSCMSHGCGGTVDMGSPTASDRYYTGWPSYMIDASAVRNRAMQWLAFRYRLSGELYWETAAAFGADPWNDQWNLAGGQNFSGNGEGTLFYPGTVARIGGTTDVPVASIRLKMIREGMEDYEYLRLLSDAGDPALAHAIADGLFPHAYETEKSPADLMAARARIAARIVELGGGQAGPGSGGGGPSTGGGSGVDPAGLPVSGCSSSGGALGGAAVLLGLAGAIRRRRRR
jgi:hypothetical protein